MPFLRIEPVRPLDMTFSHRSLPLVFLGFSSVISQILLLREFLVSFYGNELSIGVFFASWVAWVGAGSLLGNKIARTRIASVIASSGPLLAPAISLLQLVAIKSARSLLHTPVGEHLTLVELFGLSVLILSVGCILWGVLFTTLSRRYAGGGSWHGINTSYALESTGSVIGGMLSTFVLVQSLTPFQILLSLEALAALVVLTSTDSPLHRNARLLLAGLILLVPVFFLSPMAKLEQWVVQEQWKSINPRLSFLRSIDTKYQNLALLEYGSQQVLYADGKFHSQLPNTYDAELFIHSILVQAPDAKRVLLLGGGIDGLLSEVLKYRVEKVDYVEPDNAMLSFVFPALSEQTRQSLQDPRVSVIVEDGRDYVRSTDIPYDLILINVGEPSTANTNRFYTTEFFQLCSLRLGANGLIAFAILSSADYLSDELKELNASLYHTLGRAFSSILLLPGTHAVLIGSQRPLETNLDSLRERFHRQTISSAYFSEDLFDERYDSGRREFVTSLLINSPSKRINEDSHPITYFFSMKLWNRFVRGDSALFDRITPFSLYVMMALGFLVLLVAIIGGQRERKQPSTARMGLPMGIAGFVGMSLNLLLLLNVQATFGSLYELIGGIIATQMFGLALGVACVNTALRRYSIIRTIGSTITLFFLFTLLLPVTMKMLTEFHSLPASILVVTIGGGFSGAMYGVLNKLFMDDHQEAGTIYAWDLFGSSIGSLVATSLLLPILGLAEICLIYSLIVVLLFTIPLFRRKRTHQSA